MKKLKKFTYNKLYKEAEFNIDLPDYKITGGAKLEDKKILVLGVGTARDIRFLVSKNKIWGLDNSKVAINIAKKSGINASIAGLEKPLKFSSSSFDVVVAKDVLEHLENPMELLKEMGRVLKPSGYAVVSVPNHFYLPFRLRILFGKNLIWKTIGHDHTKLFDEWDYMHLRFFTWNGFKRFLSLGGFKITKSFWDFGTLAHYNQPEIVMNYLKQRGTKDLLIKVMKIGWEMFNYIIPRRARYFIVNLFPSLFCSGFYVWVKKK